MPNRIIKETICSSQDIDDLKAEEEVFYYRLWVNCDDYGRFDARIPMLKSKLYPLRDQMKSSDIKRYLDKLIDKGMVEIYSVKGVLYGRVVSWESHQQIRAKRSKYPSIDEADSNGNHMISDDSICHRNPIQSNPIENQNPNTYTRKINFAEFVLMTQEEYEKLACEYGTEKTQDYIERLNDYVGSTGKKYKSHYHTIRNWIRKEKPKNDVLTEIIREGMQNESNGNSKNHENNSISVPGMLSG